MTKKTLHERVVDALSRSSKWLADGNEYAEAGNRDRADECYAKSQYWLDRYNALETQEFVQNHSKEA